MEVTEIQGSAHRSARAESLGAAVRRFGPLCLRLVVLGVAAAVTWTALGRPAARRRAEAIAAGRGNPAVGALLDGPGAGAVPRIVLLVVALGAVAVAGELVVRNLPHAPHHAVPPHRAVPSRPAASSGRTVAGPRRPGSPLPVDGSSALSAREWPAKPSLSSWIAPLAPSAVLISAALRGYAVDAVPALACLALVLAEFLATGRRRPPGGLALGAAIVVQPALLLFLVPAWRWCGRRRALAALAVGLALGGALRLLRPSATAASWRRLADPLVMPVAGPESRSALGVLLRLGLHGVPLLCVWSLVALVVGALALRRGARYHGDGQVLAALAVVGCASVLLSAVALPSDLGWLLLAGLGRLGRRPEDRPLWPVATATAVLLPVALLTPHPNAVSTAVVRGAGTALAAGAAVALPFRLRDDPLWQVRRAPGPTTRRPFGRPFLPLLPSWMRPVSRPFLLLELLLIQVCYGIYSYVRNAAPNRAATAVENAGQLYRLEQLLHLDAEGAVNRWARERAWLMDLMLDYYHVLHFAVPMAVLLWLYRTRPVRYRTGRTVLFVTTGLALAGYWGLPLAPPRLTPGAGLRDTPSSAGPGAEPGAVLTALTNQYAAMPSLHIGWSLWCALVVVTATRSPWARVPAVLYPVATLLVVLGTANHWLLDGVAGAFLLAAGCLVQYVLTGRRLVDPDPAPGPPGRPRSGWHPGPDRRRATAEGRGPGPAAPSAAPSRARRPRLRRVRRPSGSAR
ncbi:phosphatase PAP2 family protein [Kitasatospora indigofera]|uniref:phosphatase PAP2 family protein n=1 Tax=Kitasatospora indigofera TaxID=67307 RepID=UPI0033B37BAB